MKLTKFFVNILCFLCVVGFGTVGYVAESSGQARVSIAFYDLVRDLRYDWRPTAGDSLSFTVKVTKPPYYSGGTLTAELSDVTSYRGQHGNKANPDPAVVSDLTLYIVQNYGWRAERPGVLNSLTLTHPIEMSNSSATTYESMTLRVDCEDYAAYGKLTFSASGSTGAADPIVIKIPRDVNGNKIADGWRNDETTADPNNNNPSKNWVASWDEESGPAAPNTQRGDTVTVLDEYRGLDINGTWTETDPEGWDVFILSESGLGVASSLPGMTPRLMGSNEVDYDRGHVMPYQASNSARFGKVYAIRLKNDTDAFDRQNPDRIFGEMGLGPPSSGTIGLVFPERIRGWANFKGMGNHADTLVSQTTGHEIAHGVHLRHCPQGHGDHLNCYMWSEIDTMSPHVSQFHSHHDIDYDLKSPSFSPQTPFVIPAGKKRSYDPAQGTWALLGPNDLHPISVTAPRNGGGSDGDSGGGSGGGSGGNQNQNTINNPTIRSTNTGSSIYGCDYNAEYDYCTDTGTCTTRTGPNGIGMCGHRWCCCAPVGTETSSTPSTTSSTTVTSTNTGTSDTYGCDYNAEYDYCSDTGTCTTRTGPNGIGMCGHRWCCCATQ